MAFDRLTWIGLMVVALGWALLLSGTSAIDALAHLLGQQAAPSVNFAALSQATI